MDEEMGKKERQPDLQQEAERQNRYWKKNYLWTIAILAVVIVVGLFRESGFVVTPGDDALVITMPEGESIVVPYGDVESVAMEERPDYGECLQGSDSGKTLYGTWKNDLWGEYTLCVGEENEDCVVLAADGKTVVFSGNSDAETEQLYQYLLEQCGESSGEEDPA